MSAARSHLDVAQEGKAHAGRPCRRKRDDGDRTAGTAGHPGSEPCRTVREPRDEGWVDAVTGECIAVVGTLAGAALGVGGAARISRRERRNALNDRMRDAFAVFLGAVCPAVAELREVPDVDEIPKLDRPITGSAEKKPPSSQCGGGSGKSSETDCVSGRRALPLPSPTCKSCLCPDPFGRRLMPPTTIWNDSVKDARPSSNQSGNGFTSNLWPPPRSCTPRSTPRMRGPSPKRCLRPSPVERRKGSSAAACSSGRAPAVSSGRPSAAGVGTHGAGASPEQAGRHPSPRAVGRARATSSCRPAAA